MSYAKSIIVVFSLVAAGAAIGGPPPEGAYPEQTLVAAGETRSRTDVAAETARYLAAQRLNPLPAEGHPVFLTTLRRPGKTRDEVAAEAIRHNAMGRPGVTAGEG